MNMLIVDDEPTIREACGEVAQLTGMNATMVAIAEKAIEILENAAVDIVLTDLMLPHTTGLELLKRVHETHPNLPVIVLTRYRTIDSPVAATRMGAIDYVTKPFRIEELRARLERASGAVELQQENQLLWEQLCTRPGFGGLIGYRENAASVQNHSDGRPARVPRGSTANRAHHWNWWPMRRWWLLDEQVIRAISRQGDLAPLVTAGVADFVVRAAGSLPEASGLVEQRLRQVPVLLKIGLPPVPLDNNRAEAFGEVFRHHFSHQQSAQTIFRPPLTTVLSNGAVLLLG
jgi:CheY-like chemotaxis protein